MEDCIMSEKSADSNVQSLLQIRNIKAKDIFRKDFDAYYDGVRTLVMDEKGDKDERVKDKIAINSVFSISGNDSVSIAMSLIFFLCRKNKYEKNASIVNTNFTAAARKKYTIIERTKLKVSEFVRYSNEQKYYLLLSNSSSTKVTNNSNKEFDSKPDNRKINFPVLVVYKNMRKDFAIQFDNADDFNDYYKSVRGLVLTATDLWKHILFDKSKSIELTFYKNVLKTAQLNTDDFGYNEEYQDVDEIGSNDCAANYGNTEQKQTTDISFFKWEEIAYPKYINRAVQFEINYRIEEWKNRPNTINAKRNHEYKIWDLWQELYNLNTSRDIEAYLRVERVKRADNDVSRELEEFLCKLKEKLTKWHILLNDFDSFCSKYARGGKQGYDKKENHKRETTNENRETKGLEENMTNRDIIKVIKEKGQQSLFLSLIVEKCQNNPRKDSYRNCVLKIVLLYEQLTRERIISVNAFYKEYSNRPISEMLNPVINTLEGFNAVLNDLGNKTINDRIKIVNSIEFLNKAKKQFSNQTLKDLMSSYDKFEI